MSCEHHAGLDCEICWRDRIEALLERLVAAVEHLDERESYASALYAWQIGQGKHPDD